MPATSGADKKGMTCPEIYNINYNSWKQSHTVIVIFMSREQGHISAKQALS